MIAPVNVPKLVKRLSEQSRETEWLEFKSSDTEPKKLGQNISAIANASIIEGREKGYIVWGIQDEDHRVIGTTFSPNSKRVKGEDLEHWLSKKLVPSVNFRFYEDRVDGKPVVVLVVPSALHRPVRFDNEAFIRIGSHTRRLREFPEKERYLWNLLHSTIFEKEAAIRSIEDNDILRLLDYESYFDLIKIPVPHHKSGILKELQQEQFVRQRDDGMWDILSLGSLAFARNLGNGGSLRRKVVRIIQYPGSIRTQSRQLELPLGYATGFSKIIDHVNSLAPVDETFNGGIRKESPRFPVIAVREMIANALIHQDFTARGAGPLIEIFKDRIEVSNPGVPLIAAEHFINAPPKSRNEALAALLRRLGICEESGSGWDKIVHEIEIRQLPAPRIEVISDSTRVTLYAAKPLSEMNAIDRRRAIYLHACLQYVRGASVTNTTVRKRFGMTQKNRAKASRLLAEALADGKIVPVNPNSSRKFMEYHPYWAGATEDDL